jgi:hypothetical protein
LRARTGPAVTNDATLVIERIVAVELVKNLSFFTSGHRPRTEKSDRAIVAGKSEQSGAIRRGVTPKELRQNVMPITS